MGDVVDIRSKQKTTPLPRSTPSSISIDSDSDDIKKVVLATIEHCASIADQNKGVLYIGDLIRQYGILPYYSIYGTGGDPKGVA